MNHIFANYCSSKFHSYIFVYPIPKCNAGTHIDVFGMNGISSLGAMEDDGALNLRTALGKGGGGGGSVFPFCCCVPLLICVDIYGLYKNCFARKKGNCKIND